MRDFGASVSFCIRHRMDPRPAPRLSTKSLGVLVGVYIAASLAQRYANHDLE